MDVNLQLTFEADSVEPSLPSHLLFASLFCEQRRRVVTYVTPKFYLSHAQQNPVTGLLLQEMTLSFQEQQQKHFVLLSVRVLR